MPYLTKKNRVAKTRKNGELWYGPVAGRPEKYRFLLQEQVSKLLDAVATDTANRNRHRDHCALFCGFHFGLRISECAIIDRETFQWIADGHVNVQTLKQKKKKQNDPPPRKPIDRIENYAVEYVKNYINSRMHPEQRYLFITRSIKSHISARMLDRVFHTYLIKAGLPDSYTWHSLRHARGVFAYESLKDIVKVQKMLRHKSLDSTSQYMHMLEDSKGEDQRKLEQSSSMKMKLPE